MTCKLRYRGQSFELPVPGREAPEPADLVAGFAAEHAAAASARARRWSSSRSRSRSASRRPTPVPGPLPTPRSSAARAGSGSQGDWLDADVVRGEPGAGADVAGPCVLELPETTLVLPPGWAGAVDEHGTVVAERAG